MRYGGSMMSNYMLMKAFLLVVLSFFTLLGVSKTDSKGLKKFGRLLVSAMWAIAAIIVVTSIYSMVTGKSCSLSKKGSYKKHYQMMKQKPSSGMQHMSPDSGTVPGN